MNGAFFNLNLIHVVFRCKELNMHDFTKNCQLWNFCKKKL